MCFCGLSARLHSSKVLRCQTWRSLQSAIEKRELSQLLSLIYYPRSRYTLRYASSVRHISKISTWVLLQILKKGSFRLHTHARKSSARKARVYPIQTHLKKQRKERHQRSKRKTSLHPLGLDRRTWKLAYPKLRTSTTTLEMSRRVVHFKCFQFHALKIS